MCILPIIAILASEFQFDPTFEISKLNYSGIDVHVASKLEALTVILVASESMAASKEPQNSLNGRNSNLTSDLKSATRITLESRF